MSKGISLHIGLNHVDPAGYPGVNIAVLKGCLNDVASMKAIAEGQGYVSNVLTESAATSSAVVSKIAQIAGQLSAGDMFFLTYSGHGSQVPDLTGEEADGFNETWVLWDRMLLDNELYALWGRFAAGVKIFVLSDSCHSGTIVRALMISTARAMRSMGTKSLDLGLFKTAVSRDLSVASRDLSILSRDLSAVTRNLSAVSRELSTASGGLTVRSGPSEGITVISQDSNFRQPKFLPFAQAMDAYEARSADYLYAASMAGPKAAVTVNAKLISISGCQDNQTSLDGVVNGLFTEQLLNTWNNGSFAGGYKEFHTYITAQLPADHSPNLMTLGTSLDDFLKQKPFVIGSESSTSGSGSSSSSGSDTTTPSGNTNPGAEFPKTWGRNNEAPQARINKGGNPYYYMEITSDASLFDYDTNGRRRNSSNFYATWADDSVSSRLTSDYFKIPSDAWGALKGNDKLYYRIGTTSSSDPNKWENFMLSISADDASSAPYMQIMAAGVTDNSGNNDGGDEELELSASVGRNGSNRASDVRLVQRLLNSVPVEEGGPDPHLDVDGKIGNNTINAIVDFQNEQGLDPDGLISADGETFSALKEKSSLSPVY